MPLYYKFDVLTELKERGYSTYKLRSEKILSESTLQKLRNGEMVATSNIETFCDLLHCQPGDIIGHKEKE